jgi:hypothetical protein
MILNHLSRPRVWNPAPGNRQFIAPLTSFRRPPIAPREPQLPLENKA